MMYSDREILEAIASGEDRHVLKYMYDKYFPRVKKFVMKNSGDSDSALDVFQDCMVVFYKYVMSCKFDTRYEVGAFLYTVGRNIWLNRMQKEKRNVSFPEHTEFADEGSGIIDLLISRERENAVAGILEKIGRKCRELLQYSVFYKLRNSEICRKMGFSTENAVKTQKYKCIQKLAVLVKGMPELKSSLQE
jgi:RNA polymerase sigma factor (sigma-70 family)